MKALGIVTERRGKNSRYGSVRHEIHRWAGPKPSLRCEPLRNLSTTKLPCLQTTQNAASSARGLFLQSAISAHEDFLTFTLLNHLKKQRIEHSHCGEHNAEQR